MTRTRRDFLKESAAAAALFAASNKLLSACAAVRNDEPSPPKKLLILGGTGFLGPAIVECARSRGHVVTLFNRGKTRPQLFPDVEKLHGDRDPKKGDGLKQLEGRQWDTVFDDCGYYPRMVDASARLLGPNVQHYVYISSISAYAHNEKVDADETEPLATMVDPTLEEMGKDFEYYGALKALCERAAETAMPGRVAVVRPGYIVGPEDFSDRFTYWPLRVERGGEVLAPGTPDDPIQIIDVRDLAKWAVRLAETKTTGVFNACGPAEKLSMGSLLDVCKRATSSNASFTWVPADFLAKQGESGDGNIPIWIAPVGDNKGSHTWSNARARNAGLTFRPTIDTVKDLLAWWKTLPEERRAKPHAGLPPEREAEILKAWHEARA
ncbi:MAG: twin-arginine translocation signal domain-containing protein [Planctomycetes bacterium]|nr:twin-arginine translocation signal domain-containing protein [Planctomycetota bacterium]MBI3845015.1 twin-arginine translocation signal domain-containing protein [Planctomycetota bacterium]